MSDSCESAQRSRPWIINLRWRQVVKNLLRHPIETLKKLGKYRADFMQFGRANKRQTFVPQLSEAWPLLYDWDNTAGSLSYYFWQDLWAAKKIFQHKPSIHFDIASRVDGFVAHLLTFMPVTLIDIRPLPYEIDGLSFVQADAANMAAIKENSIESLSSLCAIEHFGLGRYGDPIDPEACFKSISEMQRVLAPNGRLYAAVPVGLEGIYFNAHRVFSPATIISAFSELDMVDFSVVDDRPNRAFRFIEHADPHAFEKEICDEGALVGLFEFTKKL
jgi:hypothetical protein